MMRIAGLQEVRTVFLLPAHPAIPASCILQMCLSIAFLRSSLGASPTTDSTT